MNEKKPPSLLSKRKFIKRIMRNILIGLGFLSITLSLGMLGYIYFENMSWPDAYVNAAMILAGMGEVGTINTVSGKIFAGCYALFCGVIFLITIAYVFTPVIHRFFHRFNIEEEKK